MQVGNDIGGSTRKMRGGLKMIVCYSHEWNAAGDGAKRSDFKSIRTYRRDGGEEGGIDKKGEHRKPLQIRVQLRAEM